VGLLEATPILVLFMAVATQNCSKSAASSRFGIHTQRPEITSCSQFFTPLFPPSARTAPKGPQGHSRPTDHIPLALTPTMWHSTRTTH
jgi:hypothetical protein